MVLKESFWEKIYKSETKDACRWMEGNTGGGEVAPSLNSNHKDHVTAITIMRTSMCLPRANSQELGKAQYNECFYCPGQITNFPITLRLHHIYHTTLNLYHKSHLTLNKTIFNNTLFSYRTTLSLFDYFICFYKVFPLKWFTDKILV